MSSKKIFLNPDLRYCLCERSPEPNIVQDEAAYACPHTVSFLSPFFIRTSNNYQFVTPAPYQVRGKLRRESSNVKRFWIPAPVSRYGTSFAGMTSPITNNVTVYKKLVFFILFSFL